jgi:ABC-type arginine transport system ATPase subunit
MKIRSECKKNLQIYRKRQAIVEHPFGIIKRQWDFYYIMTKKSIKRASADVGIIFTCYNLRRIFNILDKDVLKEYLKAHKLQIFVLRDNFKQFRLTFLWQIKIN